MDFKPEEKFFCEALRQIDWNKIELVYVDQDRSILAGENGPFAPGQRRRVERFLKKYALEGCQGGTGCLLGRHAFFYGAPNALAPILLPFFRRVEDFTIYPSDNFVGITQDIINYDMDDGQGGKIRRRKGKTEN